MLKSLFGLFTVACADADLHLLQMAARRQDPEVDEEGLEFDDPVVDAPELNDDELDMGEDGSSDAAPAVDDPALLQVGRKQDMMVLEDHLVLVDLKLNKKKGDAELPPANAHGVYPDQRPVLKRGDIRGFLPNVASMSKCQCEGEKRKSIGTGSVLYHRGVKRCLLLKTSVNFEKRMAHRGWSASNKLVCEKVMKWYTVPKTCAGLRGFDHAKCTKLIAAAGYTWGTWRAKKNCFQTVSTNPKLYDWEAAKDYCLTGNSYCNGIAKLTVKKNGKYVNEYTFCKAYKDRFVVGNLKATWPYGGVLEVRRQPRVELSEDEMNKFR